MTLPPDPLPTPVRSKRRWRRRLLYSAAGLAAAAGAVGIAMGPAAPWIVDHVSDGVKLGRYGRLRIEGVTGSGLGDLHVRSLALEDENGAWAEARDITVRWRPLDLLLNAHTHIESAEAAAITILRKPVLSEARPPRAASFHVDIDALRIATLTMEEPFVGARGVFTATASAHFTDQAVDAADLELRRLDSDADRAIAHFRARDEFALHIDVLSEAGGVIGRALGVPDQVVRIAADGEGRGPEGTAHFESSIGAANIASGDLRWSAERWSVAGSGRLDVLPTTETIARRLGDSVAFELEGAPAGAFTVRATTPFLTANIEGQLDEQWALVGPARVVIETARLSAIAREAPFELGAARFEGALTRANGVTALSGAFDARDMEIAGRRARLSGPLQVQLNAERFTLATDLRAPEQTAALFANARLETRMSYDRARGRYALERAVVTGDALALTAQGWANDGDGEFAGEWRMRNLDALFDGLRGETGGRWRAFAAANGDEPRVWTTAMDGVGTRITGSPDIVPQLLGRAPRLDGLFKYENGGVSVEHVRVDGAQLRAGATGRIVRGEANLNLEASARGPLTLGDALISGVVDVTGRLTGRIARPTLTARAQLASFEAAGVEVVQPQVDFTLAPAGNAYRGQAQMQGRYGDQPVTATSGVSIAGGVLSLPGLDAKMAALEARGDAQISSRGVSARLALSGGLDGLAEGLIGRVQGNAVLTPETVTLDAQLADARAGDLRVRAATVTASGPYRAIEARFDMRGALKRAPLTFAGTATIGATDAGMDVAIQGSGALAGAAIATRSPLVVRRHGDAMEASMDVNIADGNVTAQWRERARVLQGVATIGETQIAPLAAIWGERATGRIGGQVELTNTGGGLSGEARVRLTDARFTGRQRGALTGEAVAHLEPNRITATIDATSSDGLVAHLEADAPVTTSATPFRIALAPQRRGRASWTVRGPAGALWTAARLDDQDLEGDLSGQGEIQFGAGYLAGDGRIEIANGRFEDKVSGVKLEHVQAAIAIHQDGVTIERFAATDSRGGTMTATGGSANPREGRIEVTLHSLQFVDRPDARARANGALTFVWEGANATLDGALNIQEADLNVAQNPEAGIPTLDVIEINQPGGEDEIEPAPRAALGATRLNMRINAPGRVFTRGRGVEAEWALDLRVGGTSAAPLLYGEAQALRGTLSLSGQPFEIDNGRIFFNGEPTDARINLAATRTTSDLTARILLSGTAADPDVAFSSDPPLPEDEILPQILFGHSVEDLNALEAAQLAASLAALSGRASFNIVDAARAAAGLDRFNVRQDAAGGFLVAGGVYLTREVYVEVQRTGLGQAATRVEWTIRPKLVLVTSFLSNGDQRASIRWRRESD